MPIRNNQEKKGLRTVAKICQISQSNPKKVKEKKDQILVKEVGDLEDLQKVELEINQLSLKEMPVWGSLFLDASATITYLTRKRRLTNSLFLILINSLLLIKMLSIKFSLGLTNVKMGRALTLRKKSFLGYSSKTHFIITR